MNVGFISRFNNYSTVFVHMVQPSILKSYKYSKMIETYFYRLHSIMHSIMTGSKIIVGSCSKVWQLTLKLSSVFTSNLLSYWLEDAISLHLCRKSCHVIRYTYWHMDVNTYLWLEIEHKQWPGKGCCKQVKMILIPFNCFLSINVHSLSLFYYIAFSFLFQWL